MSVLLFDTFSVGFDTSNLCRMNACIMDQLMVVLRGACVAQVCAVDSMPDSAVSRFTWRNCSAGCSARAPLEKSLQWLRQQEVRHLNFGSPGLRSSKATRSHLDFLLLELPAVVTVE
eukprot:2577642-Amphidinium_carterae.1